MCWIGGVLHLHTSTATRIFHASANGGFLASVNIGEEVGKDGREILFDFQRRSPAAMGPSKGTGLRDGTARTACGRDGSNSLPLSGGEPISSPRETTQPNRVDAENAGRGLTAVYLQGALERARSTSCKSGRPLSSVPEVAAAREHHRQPVFVGGGNHLSCRGPIPRSWTTAVAPAVGHGVEAVAERKKGIGRRDAISRQATGSRRCRPS